MRPSPSLPLFHSALYRMRRERLGVALHDHPLVAFAARNMQDALSELHAPFPNILASGLVTLPARADTIRVVRSDYARSLLHGLPTPCVVGSPDRLCFADDSFDLVVSVLELHALFDVPAALLEWRRVLKPGGVLLVNFWGGETLHELRRALVLAEAERGVVPRVSPFVEVKTLGSLAHKAGFSLVVSDSDVFTALYATLRDLFSDLHRMGEGSILHARHPGLVTPRWMARVQESYRQISLEHAPKLPARFELISLFGVKPS